jgi:hypothetical protein
MIKKRSGLCMASLVLANAVAVVTVQAIPITLESAPLDAVDSTRTGGYDVDSHQFLGWRFRVDQTFEVTAVGGNFTGVGGSGGLFAAIVSLSRPGALPLGSPFLPEEVLGTASWLSGGVRMDQLVPLSVTLAPGTYGLVFGSGAFGVNGQSTMSFLVTDPSGSPDLFAMQTDLQGINPRWVNSGAQVRFLVQGMADGAVSVPDSSPSLVSVLPIAALLAAAATCRRRQVARSDGL